MIRCAKNDTSRHNIKVLSVIQSNERRTWSIQHGQ